MKSDWKHQHENKCGVYGKAHPIRAFHEKLKTREAHNISMTLQGVQAFAPGLNQLKHDQRSKRKEAPHA